MGRKSSPNDNDDSVIDRDRNSRLAYMTLCVCFVFVIPMLLGILLFGFVHLEITGMVIGFVVGTEIFWRVFPAITVYVPFLQGLASSDTLQNGQIVTYGPGTHPRFSWEDIEKDNHVSLKDVTEVVELTMQVSDGTAILVFQYRWKPKLRLLNVYFAHSIESINISLTGLFKEFFSSTDAKLTVNEVRGGMRVISLYAREVYQIPGIIREDDFSAIEKAINAKVRSDLPKLKEQVHEAKKLRTKEDSFGITMLDTEIIEVKFPLAQQEARNARAEGADMRKAVMEQLGLDPEKPGDVAKYAALPIKEINKLLGRAAIVARVPGITEENQNLNIEGDAIAGVVALLTKLLGKDGGSKGRKPRKPKKKGGP